jgi:hypothetical protein
MLFKINLQKSYQHIALLSLLLLINSFQGRLILHRDSNMYRTARLTVQKKQETTRFEDRRARAQRLPATQYIS